MGNIPEGDYKVLIRGIDADGDFQEEVDLHYHSKTESVFIQLDKPVYKPGDVLRFRVVVVDENTRPATSIKSVSVTLYDPKGNMINRWPFGMLYKGVFESSVQLASAPELGTWNLVVTTASNVCGYLFCFKFIIKLNNYFLANLERNRVKGVHVT